MIESSFTGKKDTFFHCKSFSCFCFIHSIQHLAPYYYYPTLAVPNDHTHTGQPFILINCTINIYLIKTRWWCCLPNICRLLSYLVYNQSSFVILMGLLCKPLDLGWSKAKGFMDHFVPSIPYGPSRGTKNFQVIKCSLAQNLQCNIHKSLILCQQANRALMPIPPHILISFTIQ